MGTRPQRDGLIDQKQLEEALRLREAYARRGPVERRLVGNRGQRMLVEERNEGLTWALSRSNSAILELLEIGCGEGSIVAGLRAAGLVRHGVGIDILPEVIEIGRTAHPDIELAVGDAAELPFEDARFDVVLASTVLSSVRPGQKRVEIFREVDRVLKPGGLFVWYDMRVRSPMNPAVRPIQPREIQADLPGYRLAWRSITLVPPLARRLGRRAPWLYPLLARVPLLRTHTVGAAIKPGSGEPRSIHGDIAQPFVSVLLPVRNEKRELTECLQSLAAQGYPHDRFEVLIADASNDGVDAAAIPGGLDVRIVPNPEQLMSRGLNAVAAAARGEYLAIVSAHSLLPPDYLERITAVALGRRAANVGTRVRKVATSPWGRAIAAATSSPLGVGGAGQHHSPVPGPADSAFPGFIDREMFLRIGGFNPELACNEDDEFNARLRDANGLVWYEPGLEVVYKPRESLSAAFHQHYRYGRWKVAVARTGVRGYLRLRHLAPAAFVVCTAATPLGMKSRRLRIPLLGGLALYIGAVAVDGRRMAAEYRADAWRVVAVYPTIHLAYGLGFLRGLLDRGMPKER